MSSANIHPKFTVTPGQLRAAFDAHVTLGNQRRRVSFGEMRTADLSPPFQDGWPWQLSIVFMAPIDQAAVEGYDFGLNTTNRTAGDRNSFENLVIQDVSAHLNEIDFRLFLDPPQDRSMDTPGVSFSLINASGNRVEPKREPSTLIFQGRDIVEGLAVAQRGRALIFPLLSSEGAVLTDDMSQFNLIVNVNGAEQEVRFPL